MKHKNVSGTTTSILNTIKTWENDTPKIVCELSVSYDTEKQTLKAVAYNPKNNRDNVTFEIPLRYKRDTAHKFNKTCISSSDFKEPWKIIDFWDDFTFYLGAFYNCYIAGLRPWLVTI